VKRALVKFCVSIFYGIPLPGKPSLRQKKAQALTEYVLILGAIALACMAASKVFHSMLLQCYKNLVFILCIPIP
jgi:hypothetical protein